jgi:uncharacterized coiled-coil DUF342 family protein
MDQQTSPLNLSHFDKSIDDIKDLLKDMQLRLRELEQREAGASPLVNAKLDALWRKSDEQSARMVALEKQAIETKQTMALLM